VVLSSRPEHSQKMLFRVVRQVRASVMLLRRLSRPGLCCASIPVQVSMRYREPILPAIVAGDVIGFLLCAWMLHSLLAWACWLLYLVGFDLMLFYAFRDPPPIHIRPLRKSPWHMGRRLANVFGRKAITVLLVELLAAAAGYAIGLDPCTWSMYMGIVNMLLYYWHAQMPERRPVREAPNALTDAAIRLGRLRQLRPSQPAGWVPHGIPPMATENEAYARRMMEEHGADHFERH